MKDIKEFGHFFAVQQSCTFYYIARKVFAVVQITLPPNTFDLIIYELYATSYIHIIRLNSF